MKRILFLLVFVAGLSCYAQTSSFTYQGRLSDGNAAATGNYDLQFVLRDAASAGNPVGSALTNSPVVVSNGLFTITLDFGAAAFNGNARWLEIGVRTNGSASAFTILSPRQQVTSAPYAIQAANAGTVSGAIADSQLSGNIPRLSGGAAFTGTVTAGSFTGNGGGLTNLSAGNLTGTIADARLSTNVARLNVPNTVTPATATPVITSGFITGANVTSGGSGYLTPPTVTVNDSTGSGAALTANISGGIVTSLTANVAGSNYSGGATLTMTPPPSNAYQSFISSNFFSGPNTFTGTALFNPVSGAPFVVGNANKVINFNADLLDGQDSTAFWNRNGNAGTAPGTDFIGTSDNQALEFKVNGSRALRLEPNATSPNVIGGYSGNYMGAGIVASAISGGGFNGNLNSIFANYSAIGGGFANTIQTNADISTIGGGNGNTIQPNADHSTIGGGTINTIQFNASYSTIGGGANNTIQTDANISTIGGGVLNTIQTGTADSTIGGGRGNAIQRNASQSAIGGGIQNTIQTNASRSTIGGGNQNTIQTNAYESTIGGGVLNTIQTNAYQSTIGGGVLNTIQTNASQSTIGGGSGNTIQNNAAYATIGGGYGNSINAFLSTIGSGYLNTIQIAATYSTIGGGNANTIQANASYSTIGGGVQNVIQTNADYSTIGGGGYNTIQNNSIYSKIGGGYNNFIQTNAFYSTIGGGNQNTNQANGQYAVIPGGRLNVATNYAFAAGYNAQATNTGAFVWSDSMGTLTASAVSNSVTMRASGGFTFLTGIGTVGASLPAGATAWTTISDRNAKKNFLPLDSLEVLEKLEHVPIQRWNYKWEEDSAVPHIGPVAQDFKAAFYPGRDDKSISTLEFDGVELAAIHGLNQKAEAQKAELTAKQLQIESLENKNGELEKRLSQLERLVNTLAERK